jgi:hypothetical protein
LGKHRSERGLQEREEKKDLFFLRVEQRVFTFSAICDDRFDGGEHFDTRDMFVIEMGIGRTHSELNFK